MIGLTTEEAARRLNQVGPNRLPPPAPVPVWRKLGVQLVHFFALMLWVAGVLAIIGGLPELGIAIFVVVLLNAVFAFLQEERADHAAQRLRELLPTKVTVLRDGIRVTVDAADLVPGDVVMLESGDRISADLRCIEAHGLLLDRSLLTGESVPDSVEPGSELLAGCFIVEGEGLAQVERTGATTRLAEIARLTQDAVQPDTPLARELRRLVRTVAVIAVTTGGVFFTLSSLLGSSVSDGFIFAVGVTVALVPEGLLPTVTLSLALGAQRMADNNALVRRLEAVETLGSTTFICTDKTGTLTQNRMNVVEVWTPVGTVELVGVGYEPEAVVTGPEPARAAARVAALAARRCSAGRALAGDDGQWRAEGDPMEAAIDALASRLGVDCHLDAATDPDLRRYAFDARRRRASVATATRLMVKGSTDTVFDRCLGIPAEARAAAEALAARGLRILAVGIRERSGEPGEADHEERDLTLVGILALEDPPRPHAAAAIAACRKAGVRIGMITGDHPATAAAIADEVGLRLAQAPVLVGADLPADLELLGALVDRDGVVVARVTPEDKLRIAQSLHRRGHVLAMTGDGVNDGPALREADIGVAMGASGTDVAREAADLVLLDDDFASIVAAISQGRATFANTRRFLTYHLTDNVAELTPFVLWALSGSRFPLALGVLQILALDIGTDTLPAAALGAEPPVADVLDRPPISGRLLDRTVAIRAFGILGPTEAAFEMGAFLVALGAAGWRPGESFPTGRPLEAASGAAFLAVVLAQFANAMACRSARRAPWELGWARNRWLLWAIGIEGVVVACFVFVPAVAGLLEHRPPPAAAWLVILAAPFGLLGIDLLWKRLVFRPGHTTIVSPGRPPAPDRR